MSHSFKVFALLVLVSFHGWSQVDTTYIYNQDTPYGTLDVRIAKSETRYYYLEEGVTFSFRENSPGVKTNTFKDMTAWDSSPYSEGNLREQIDDQSAFVMNYRLLKPANYNDSYNPGYPLLVLMHGSGETGNCWNSNCFHGDQNYSPVTNDPPAPTDPEHELLNNDHSLLHGGKVYLDAVNRAGDKLPNDPMLPGNAFPGFVLFPQNLNGWSANTVQDAIRIIRLLSKKYNIDEDRIYIHGISNGGYGVYEALKRTPWMFASAIAMSAVSDGFITNAGIEAEISNIKLWIFQGALDTNPLPQKTRKYVDRFRLAGVEVRYTEYADVGHTVWNRAYKEPDFFTWFLGHRQSIIHPFGGVPVICNTNGLKLELPEGFLAYQWQKDGVIIDGANSSDYMATEPGKYRARFSRLSTSPDESDWNEWSPELEVTEKDPPTAAIRQIGSVVLKDLNNLNEANLEADQDYARYYWYKNGSLMNLAGNQDDTLKSITIKPGNCAPTCAGNGVYTLVTLDYNNCSSQPSAPKHVFLSDQAPVNMQSPSGLTGSSPAPSTVDLSWTDNAADELGYEVWRRTKTGGSQYSEWEMITLTPSGATSYGDDSVEPFQSYQYKIRAVGSAGRSHYVPDGEGLEVATSADTTPPAPPSDVTSQRIGLEKVLIRWTRAIDDTDIRHYFVNSELGELQTHEADTFLLVDNLQVDTLYHFTVRAVDLGNNVSEPSETITIATSVSGLFYEHSPGSWSTLDSIDWSRPEYTGSVTNFTTRPKIQDDYFYLRFDGYVSIETAGDYVFRISSDDGSRLMIDTVLIADNDGIHEMTSAESSVVSLSEGPHRITVQFFEYMGTDSIAVEYNGPDTQNEWKVIPDEVLRSNLVIATEPDLNKLFNLDVFPNPGNQHDLQVKVNSVSTLPVTISMIDQLGKAVFKNIYNPSELKSGVRLPIDNKINSGMYILRVRQGSSHQIRKVMIKAQ